MSTTSKAAARAGASEQAGKARGAGAPPAPEARRVPRERAGEAAAVPAWRADLVAGLTNGILSVPQGIAFALIAGVDPRYGLYAMIVPTIAAAWMRESPYLQAGATNTSALVIGSMILTLPAVRSGALTPLAAMLLITFLMGLIQALAGLVKLGGISRYVSQAVSVGFTLGAAIVIGGGQIKNVLGVTLPRAPSFMQDLWAVFQNLGQTHGKALVIAGLTWAIVIGGAKISRALPGTLIAIIASGALVALGGWDHGPGAIPVTKAIPAGLPPFALPPLGPTGAWFELGGAALAIAVLGIVETLSIGKALHSQARRPLHANRELLALGAGNLLGSFFQCMPSSASWTRSAVNAQMGARTHWAGVIAGLLVLAVVLLLAPWARYIPTASLGALIIWIAFRMVDPKAVRYVWRWSKTEAGVLVITAVSMLLLPLQYAIYLGVFVSLLVLVRRAGRLRMVEMVQGSGGLFREIEMDSETGSFPVVLLQLEGDLFFGVVEELERRLERIAANGARVIVLRMKRAHAIDATAAEALAQFVEGYRKSGGRLILCGLKSGLHARIARGRLGEVLGPGSLMLTENRPFTSVQAALKTARAQLAARGEGALRRPLIRQAPERHRDAWHYQI